MEKTEVFLEVAGLNWVELRCFTEPISSLLKLTEYRFLADKTTFAGSNREPLRSFQVPLSNILCGCSNF